MMSFRTFEFRDVYDNTFQSSYKVIEHSMILYKFKESYWSSK